MKRKGDLRSLKKENTVIIVITFIFHFKIIIFLKKQDK